MNKESYFVTGEDGNKWFVYVDQKTGEERYLITEDEPDDFKYYCSL